MSDSSQTTTSGKEERVSALVGDRLCTNCGYNLTGQPVVREPHYRMLIVRCSECATVASLQEYPLLGRWAGRWAMLGAAMWFAASAVFLLLTASAIIGSATLVVETASTPLAVTIAEHHLTWLKAQDPDSIGPQLQWQLTMGAQTYVTLDPTWWATQDPAAFLVEAGGWTGGADWSALGSWGWLSVYILAVGCFWAVLLAHLRRKWLVLFSLLPVGIAGLFAIAIYAGDTTAVGGWATALSVAQQQLGPLFCGLSIAYALLPLNLGLFFGRPITRLLIRALLPPRLRNSLALLWTTDDLDPPRA